MIIGVVPSCESFTLEGSDGIEVLVMKAYYTAVPIFHGQYLFDLTNDRIFT